MRFEVDFEPLQRNVQKMGAQLVRVPPLVDIETAPRDRVDIDLPSGIEIDIKEIETVENLLAYKQRHILVYIQDHGWHAGEVISGLHEGKKYHVAWCSTLDHMRRIGRYSRYVVTNDRSGSFTVTGTDESGKSISGRAQLKVCKNCLQKLDYDGYTQDKERAFARFDLDKFFEDYESHFQVVPTRIAGEQDATYTDDWLEIAKHTKANFNHTCQGCGVDLGENNGLLHVHHINGVKTDNRSLNLDVLCAICHKDSPHHSHVRITAMVRHRIEKLRREQGIS